MWVQDKVAVEINRGAESWQFFAFIFAAVYGLLITSLDEFGERFRKWPLWARLALKILLFALCFYLLLINKTVRNALVVFLGWLKTERYN
jgi:TRAP-type uncharacterized transport system fused permease subunit